MVVNLIYNYFRTKPGVLRHLDYRSNVARYHRIRLDTDFFIIFSYSSHMLEQCIIAALM